MKSLKRIIIVAIALVATVASANAQFKFGIKAGMNVNKVHFNKEIINDFMSNSTGWTAGVMAEFTVPVIGVAVDASVMYARMNNGADNYVFDMEDATEKNLFSRNFLEIPVNLKYKLTLPVVSKFLKPYIFTGPNFAFRLDKNVIEDMKTKKCEIAWNVGLGLELMNHLQVGASYGFGINNILDASNVLGISHINNEKIKARNNYWTITAAYLF